VLCCVVLCCMFVLWCSRINCTVLKVQMKVILWRLRSCTSGDGGLSCALMSVFVLCCVVCVQFGAAGLIALC